MLLPPLSLYIHMPWCIRKCPYCDFNSHAVTGEMPEKAYIDALLSDWEQEQKHLQHRKIQSIFQFLLAKIGENNALAPQCEITMEANPGTFEIERFAQFRAAGVNRLSLGIQSFNNDHLKILGRVHGKEEAHLAASHAPAVGFDNFNLDLMYALPHQTTEQALADLKTAIEYQPNHISWYQLTLEPNTAFWRQPPPLPQDDSVIEIENAGRALLAEKGYKRYEVSAYAKKDFRSVHNLNYWEFGDYIGIGAGAHGKMTTLATGEIQRCWKLRSPARYLSADNKIANQNILKPEDRSFEFMLNALRLTEGCDRPLFSERTGLEWASVEHKIAQMVQKELMIEPSSTIAATELGQRFLNDLVAEFLV
jgi:putative oxygen-independent coproporphyrinogen III oxidase